MGGSSSFLGRGNFSSPGASRRDFEGLAVECFQRRRIMKNFNEEMVKPHDPSNGLPYSHVILACFRVLFDSVHRLYHVCICNGEPSHSYANAVKSMTICSSVANLKIETTIHARRSRLPGHNVYTAHSPSPFMHAHNIMNIENQ
ncbi:hypothetical protein VNO77_37235 [Canavalia gladiata]|uniref:Uncharacterized protein n=1 Tax=Canavalia gladiata TaxID=3824 RepID=A0AAN9KAW4_CANGL